MTGLDRLARGIGVVWAGFVIGIGLFVRPDIDHDARVLVAGAFVVAVAAALTAAVASDRGSSILAGAALVVAGIAAPTFAAVWLDVVPIAVGGALLVRAVRRRGMLAAQH
jgi:hypothetical protein